MDFYGCVWQRCVRGTSALFFWSDWVIRVCFVIGVRLEVFVWEVKADAINWIRR